MLPLLFEPGMGYQVSNAGINTAGRIIEILSGMPYEQFMADRLFLPLGMKDTSFRPTHAQVSRFAKSYRANNDATRLDEVRISQLKYPLDGPDRYPMPGGGLFSLPMTVAVFVAWSSAKACLIQREFFPRHRSWN